MSPDKILELAIAALDFAVTLIGREKVSELLSEKDVAENNALAQSVLDARFGKKK